MQVQAAYDTCGRFTSLVLGRKPPPWSSRPARGLPGQLAGLVGDALIQSHHSSRHCSSCSGAMKPRRITTPSFVKARIWGVSMTDDSGTADVSVLSGPAQLLLGG